MCNCTWCGEDRKEDEVFALVGAEQYCPSCADLDCVKPLEVGVIVDHADDIWLPNKFDYAEVIALPYTPYGTIDQDKMATVYAFKWGYVPPTFRTRTNVDFQYVPVNRLIVTDKAPMPMFYSYQGWRKDQFVRHAWNPEITGLITGFYRLLRRPSIVRCIVQDASTGSQFLLEMDQLEAM